MKGQILRKNRTLGLILRIGISLLIISFLIYKSDAVEILKSLLKTNYNIWMMGVLLYILGQAISSYKWKLLAETAGFQNKFRAYLDYYFIGMFFNLFLPTTVGGDVTRCYYLSKNDAGYRRAPAVYSVLAERYTGVVILVFMATIAMFFPVGNPVPFGIKIFMLVLSSIIIMCTPAFPVLLFAFLKKKKLDQDIV